MMRGLVYWLAVIVMAAIMAWIVIAAAMGVGT